MQTRSENTPSIIGYLLIDKPEGKTSFQCVNHIKKIIRLQHGEKVKIGHSGTLDPFATGLLIICIGREATREISSLLDLDKTYLVTAKLGELTDTLDKTGEIIESDHKIPSEEEIKQAITDLGQKYVQIPPIYSALKYKGQPLYKFARKKNISEDEVDRILEQKKRTVFLHKVELIDYKPPYFTFTAHVSKGTYIRSLANDIAKKAGSCATTYELKRTHIGKISLKNAVGLDKIKTLEDIKVYLLDKEWIKSV